MAFCLTLKLFTLGNIILNITIFNIYNNYLGWIISDIKQKGMEYLDNIKQKGMEYLLITDKAHL